MALALGNIVGWKDGLSCSPTALAAISAKTPNEVGKLLQETAAGFGREIDIERNDYSIDDWLAVIRKLGGDWALGDDNRAQRFEERPTIDEWMGSHTVPDLEFVVCDDGAGIGHVFVAHEGKVVDTYTGGKVVAFTSVPAEYAMLRVKLTFIVWEK